ncbi:MAG: DUF72 domain-containing protein [Candidatus Pacebacteria bacterium]|nr:DUF72 domain-containing protein [Candidatus Paceibacterota bacterium]
MPKIYIGTSGFEYDWVNFYNGARNKLEYYSKKFNTVEINYSFYKLPSIDTYKKWEKETPSDFCFALKLSRYITHIKRLEDSENAFNEFVKRAKYLKSKLGPILVQLPSNFKLKLDVMESFLINNKEKLAFEFRNEDSLDSKELVNLFKKYNVAFVFSHSRVFPYREIITADFVYLRMHGPKKLYGSEYGEDLKEWAPKIKAWAKNRDVYVYFNNDQNEHAPNDAKRLFNLIFLNQKYR